MIPPIKINHLSIERPSLVRVTADTLRQAIQEGRWVKCLPSERELVELLRVSRPTLRSALKILEAEDMVKGQPRSGWKLNVNPAMCTRALSGEIAVLSPFPLEAANLLAPFVLHWLDPLKDSLISVGYRLNFYAKPACYRRECATALTELTGSCNVACWLLYNSTPQMQQWFLQKKIRHIVLGSTFEAESSSSIDFDQAAICRHAVIRLQKIGHQRIGLLTKKPSLAGDIESFNAFCETFAGAPKTHVPIIEIHDGSFEKTLLAVDKMMDRRLPPSAILVLGVQETITTFTRVLERGFSIPKDLSIISRDYHPVFSYLSPPLSCYVRNQDSFANRLFLLLQAILSHATGDYHSNIRLYADFIEGKSTMAIR